MGGACVRGEAGTRRQSRGRTTSEGRERARQSERETHRVGHAGEVDEAVAVLVARRTLLDLLVEPHAAQRRIAQDGPLESADGKEVARLDLLDREEFAAHHHVELLDLDGREVPRVVRVRRREVGVVLGEDGVQRLPERHRARVEPREPNQDVPVLRLPRGKTARGRRRSRDLRLVLCHDLLGLVEPALVDELGLALLGLLEELCPRAHVIRRELPALVLRQVVGADRKHLAHVRDAVRLGPVVAAEEVGLELARRRDGLVEVAQFGVQHARDPEGLRGGGWGHLVDDGGEGRGGEGEPLREDREEEVARVLGAQVLRPHLDTERGNDLVNLCRVAVETPVVSDGRNTDSDKARERNRRATTHGLSETESYTAQILSSTNWTNKGLSFLPLCSIFLRLRTRLDLGSRYHSPHRHLRSACSLRPSLAAYSSANRSMRNAHPSMAEEKTTLPCAGSK